MSLIVFNTSVEKFNITKYFALGMTVVTHPLPISAHPNSENWGITPLEIGKNLILLLYGHSYTLQEYLNISFFFELRRLIDGAPYLNIPTFDVFNWRELA